MKVIYQIYGFNAVALQFLSKSAPFLFLLLSVCICYHIILKPSSLLKLYLCCVLAAFGGDWKHHDFFQLATGLCVETRCPLSYISGQKCGISHRKDDRWRSFESNMSSNGTERVARWNERWTVWSHCARKPCWSLYVSRRSLVWCHFVLLLFLSLFYYYSKHLVEIVITLRNSSLGWVSWGLNAKNAKLLRSAS